MASPADATMAAKKSSWPYVAKILARYQAQGCADSEAVVPGLAVVNGNGHTVRLSASEARRARQDAALDAWDPTQET